MIHGIKKVFSPQEQDNYKIFFPLALPGFFIGMGFWIFSKDYGSSRLWHPLVMMHLFLFPVVTGFLWTGIPRFEASVYPSALLKIVYFVLILAAYYAWFVNDVFLFKLLAFLSYAGLIYWFYDLMKHSKIQPVMLVPFLFYALVSAIAGTGLQFLADIYALPVPVLRTGIELHRFVFFLFLIGAVGSKMIPVMGKIPPYSKGSFSVWSFKPAFKNRFWWIAGFFIMAAGMIPVEAAPEIIVVLRILILLFFARDIWALFRMPANRTMTVWFLKAAISAILISPLFYLVPGIYSVSAAHFQFVAMFVLLVMIVAARVVLGHGGHDVEFAEKHSWWLKLAYLLVVTGMLVRPFAFLSSNTVMFYHTVAGFPFVGVVFYITGIIKIMRKRTA